MKTLNLLILFLLSLIAACNSETAKLSEISKISTSFNTGSTFYDGGVFVVGIRSDVPEKISFSSATGIIPAISLQRGDWTFYGIGYVGPQRMKGNLECGMSSVNIRGGESIAINLSLSAEGCSGKLARTVKFHSVQVDHCDGFYNYDLSLDQFFSTSTYIPGTTCAYLPADQRGMTTNPYYRIAFINSQNGVESEGVISSCRQYNNASDRVRLPISVFPYKIKTYRTQESCMAYKTPHNEFMLKNGIEARNDEEFDSIIKEVQADKTDTRIVVPSSLTKRYKSPFMANIPRFLCDGGDDCTRSPTSITPASNTLPNYYLSHVLWDTPKKNQLLMQDVVATSCDGLLYDSKYFGIKDCKIKNRFLYGTLVRNELTCRPMSGTPEQYQDLYERNGKIYLLYTSGGTAYLKIHDESGSLEHKLTLPDSSYKEVAATDSGDLFLSSPISGTQGFVINSSGSLVQNFDDPTLLLTEIEVNPSGSTIYYAEDPASNTLRIYSVPAKVSTDSVVFGQTVRKIQYYKTENSIYVHTADAPNTNSLGTIERVGLNSSTLPTPEMISVAYRSISFHISKDVLYTYGIGDGPGHVISSRKTAGVWNTVHALSDNSLLSTVADKFVAVDRGVYAIASGTSTIATNKFKLNGEWDNVFQTGLCQDTFRITLGIQSQIFTAMSEEASSQFGRNHILFDAALSSVGVRVGFQDFNRFTFNSLNKNQTKETVSGKLALVQRLLGPQGVGGMLSEFNSCESLKAITSISSFTKNYPVSDPYGGYKSYDIRVSSTTSVIPAFTCDDTTINAAGCTENYDLIISVKSTGLTESENYKMRIKCGSKKGEIDYYRYARGEVDKQLHYWNTSVEATSRSDSYELYSYNDEFRASMTYLTKSNDSNLRSRTVVLEQWDDLRTSYTMDYERNDIDHKVQLLSFSAKPASFSSLAGYGANRNTDQFSGTALVCRPVHQTQLNGSNTSCFMNSHPSVNSKGLPLSMATLENAETPGVTFQNLFQMIP